MSDKGLNSIRDGNNVVSGWIFNIQKFSLHDGPGIRDLVFMKGCPLRCQWCSNPESQRLQAEIAYKIDRCLGFDRCGLCREACPEKAITRDDAGQAAIDRSLCNNCGACAAVCPDQALEIMGRKMNINEILDVISEDEGFHFRSKGGITVGGGDPIMQADFVSALLRACQERGIDTAVETAGYGSWVQLEKVCRWADLIFYDVKCMDTEKHKAFTGVSNKIILENLQQLSAGLPSKHVIVRTPIIPGFNDTEKDISAIIEFLKTIGILKEYKLLPYHQFGTPKYGQLGRTYAYGDTRPPSQEKMRRLSELVDGPLTLRRT